MAGMDEMTLAQYKEVMLSIVDKYTGTTVFVPGDQFLPVKDI